MRALAIAMVVGVHAGMPGIPGGFVGVDVFFVISGFLITSHLSTALKRDGGINFLRFYAARAQRLLPALTLTLLTTLCLAALFLSPGEQKTVAATAAHQAIYASNIYFTRFATNYFAPDAGLNPLLHTWSLAVEEQFYIVWPLFLLAFWKFAGRKGLVAGIAVASATSFMLCVWLTDWRQPWAFYGAPARGWEFGLGAMLHFLPSRSDGARLQPYIAAAGLSAVVASTVFITEDQPFPGAIAAFAAVGAAAIIFGGGERRGLVYRLLSARPMQITGNLSYSLYLWHWPILAYAALLWPNASLVWRLAAVGAALGLAAVTYRFVEEPVRRWTWLRSKPVYAAFGAVALILVSIAAAFSLRANAIASEKNPALANYARAEAPLALEQMGCISDFAADRAKPCNTMPQSEARPVVLFGDSHAAQWYKPLEQLAIRHQRPLVTFTKSSCASVPISKVHSTWLNREYVECARWRDDALEQIMALRPEVVFITNFSGSYSKGRLKAWEAATSKLLAQLTQVGARVVIIRDTPTAGFPVPACLARSESAPGFIRPVCDFERARALDEAVWRIERTAVQSISGVTPLDLTDEFCGPTLCSATRSGKVVYKDGNHVTDLFAASLEHRFDPFF